MADELKEKTEAAKPAENATAAASKPTELAEPAEEEILATAPPDANIIFVGKERVGNKKVRSKEAPARLRSGTLIFEGLPSSEEQLRGFNYDKAAELCRAFPGLYKPIRKKGE